MSFINYEYTESSYILQLYFSLLSLLLITSNFTHNYEYPNRHVLQRRALRNTMLFSAERALARNPYTRKTFMKLPSTDKWSASRKKKDFIEQRTHILILNKPWKRKDNKYSDYWIYINPLCTIILNSL